MLSIVGVGLFMIFRISYNYRTSHNLNFTIFYILLCIFLLAGIFYAIYRGGVIINKSIDLLQLTADTVNFNTFKASLLLGIIKKDSMAVSVPRNLMRFQITGAKRFGFDRKLSGDIYILSYAGDQYLVQSNFFENFESMKQLLGANEMQS